MKDKFSKLETTKVEGITGDCAYYGQIFYNTQKPNGLGIAVDSFGAIYEGLFKNGVLVQPFMRNNGDGWSYIELND